MKKGTAQLHITICTLSCPLPSNFLVMITWLVPVQSLYYLVDLCIDFYLESCLNFYVWKQT